MSLHEQQEQLKTRVAPGVWIDRNDHVHFSVPELLDHFDIPDNEENRAKCFAMLREMFLENFPEGQLIERPERGMRYSISHDGKSITCLACLKTSFNPNDVANKYCGHCHVFHEQEQHG